MLGLFTDFVPKHARQYAQLADVMTEALTAYAQEVRDGSFPSTKESFKMDETLLDGLADAFAVGS